MIKYNKIVVMVTKHLACYIFPYVIKGMLPTKTHLLYYIKQDRSFDINIFKNVNILICRTD